MNKSRREILDESLEWWDLTLQAGSRARAQRLLDQLIIVNRAAHPEEEAWCTLQKQLETRMK